jgi:thioredoxin
MQRRPIVSLVARVTARDFPHKVLHSPVPVVVNVYADRCGLCRLLAPLLDSYAQIYEGEVHFLKVNADEESDLAGVYRVERLPTLLLFNKGRLVDRVVGFPEVPAMTARLDKLAGRPRRAFGCCG